MKYLIFTLNHVPDLSLNKYASLDESGVDGVLSKTESFLRQLNRKGILSKVFFHLLYIYDPAAAAGRRLKLYFIASGEEGALTHTRELVQNSAISAFYDIACCEEATVENIGAKSYGYAAALGKREFFVQPSVILPDDNDLRYYKVAEWEMNDGARLYNMFKLMQGLNRPAAFRVDIFSVDYAVGLRSVLPIEELRKRTSVQITRGPAAMGSTRDENAEETLRQYSDLIENYEGTPHFRANIFAFADEPGVAELIADAAGAEALSGGSYSIKSLGPQGFGGTLNACSSMERPLNIAGPDAVDHLKFMPNLFLLRELRPFFCFPALYDGETIEMPKETAPQHCDAGIDLGNDENGYDVLLPAALLKKHAFLAGVPGSGKTNSMLHLASALWKAHGVPFLILEPAKKEYRALSRIDGMDELRIFSPASGTRFPLHINPFEFPRGMSLSEHIRNLMSVFEGAFMLAPPAPFMIDNAIEAVYRAKGWYPDTINDANLPYPTMSELYGRLAQEVEKTGYEGDIKGNLKSILQVRIGSLLRREMGDVFDAPESTLSPEEWLDVPALIELEAMGSGPANFLTLLLSTLIRETLKVKPLAGGRALRHVIFFEEAHNLIGPDASEATGEDANPKRAASAFIVKMLAEVRALSEGIVIADQLPTVMPPEVIKNTGLKIGHRLTAADDRNLLGGTMSATPAQLEEMATFLPGEALVTFEGLLRPFKARVRQWENGTAAYESPANEELADIMAAKTGYQTLLRRSSQICTKKFSAMLRGIEEKTQEFLAKNDKLTADIDAVRKYMDDNGIGKKEFWAQNSANPQIEKAHNRVKANDNAMLQLGDSLSSLFTEMNELLIKLKGYISQNPAHRRETAMLLIKSAELRAALHEKVKDRYAENACMEEYAAFSKEIKGWNLSKMLAGENFDGEKPG